ncbi:MAG: hypothetical protein ACI4E1_00920 [Lachnospira sp.]
MKKFKQIAALLAVIIWVGFIILTMVVSFINNELCKRIFPGLIFTVIVFPVVIYGMMLIYKLLKGRK